VFGWIFCRLGCFLAFDHPGAPSDFFLAQVFSDNLARHNLGLYEALYFIFPLAPMFFVLGKKRRNPGFYLGLLCVAYAPIRFALDFWRIVDVRYLGFTPGQFGAVAMALAGLWFISRTSRYAAQEAQTAPAATPGKGKKA
jgi:phosphatidylglycerol:prolipoprotein diacylglycerol transferase